MKSRRVKRSKRSKSKRKKMKRRSYSRTRLGLSKSRKSNKKRPRKIRVRKSSSKKAKTPKSSYKRQETSPKNSIFDYQNVYLSDTKNISTNYPEMFRYKYDDETTKLVLSNSDMSFYDLCVYYPKTTGVYPDHPYIQTNGVLYRLYKHIQGSAFSIQSKDCIAIYSNYYANSFRLTPPLKDGEGLMHKYRETPYKCVHYGKRSALIDIGNMKYYRISLVEIGEYFEPGYQITHFFSDEDDDGFHCNVFWITSTGDLYIEYDRNYAEYGNAIFGGSFGPSSRMLSPPIKVPELQNPVLREQFLIKLKSMRQSQVTSFLRKLLDKTLFDHGIIDTMPSPWSRNIPVEKDPLALR